MNRLRMKHAVAAALALMLGIGAAAAQQSKPDGASGQPPEAPAVAPLDEQQRARISQSIAALNVAPLRRVRFSLAIGAEAPRSLKLRPLPAAAVEAAPQFRGHSFVRVDEDILIIEPKSYRIVAVMPHPKSAIMSKPKLNLTQKQREMIRAQVGQQLSKTQAPGKRATTGSAPAPEIVVGEAVPRWITIERFPDTVYRQVPAVRSYQYIARDRDIYLVDPRERRVLEMIE